MELFWGVGLRDAGVEVVGSCVNWSSDGGCDGKTKGRSCIGNGGVEGDGLLDEDLKEDVESLGCRVGGG